MSETNFTPGPWKAGRADMATIVDGIDSKWIYAGDQYVGLASSLDVASWDTVMANARLMAAAPELYAALEEVVAWDKARAALAKARGEV